MRYVGPVIQQLWAEEPAYRAKNRRHRRPSVEPGSVRRRTAPKRSQAD